ncbi:MULTISPECIES: DNA repair protein RadA [unclassified Campylobacter]|uniref:DNA repair protein RadA n=1 Tax=unclassified Campylobacter TaxID=2593542 RepID=UPI0022E9C2FB|nr:MULTISPECIES: DNA repair protein RadA [unclassified Campylobacter]MDA3042584.1 DNA repair protein RadA [Campylobacter sp. JMF_09 ED2]MDA3044602.1 DNA repair protein RadA [Campylobacter sp. JMF_07 ED4]MDA3053879.1 DNA repair protein RadA [Campylobacter sp. VBCF_07 NA4]MDA3060232.1 DNA repair protein RadA [Campylobacter sp. VBCF_02 NA5]MDA3063275.1 DNA repair protein RadA [Campylobacter sp. JMF_11 EL3]
MAKSKSTLFECQHCGNQQSRWLGKCPDCGAWDSFVELKAEQIKTLKEIEKLEQKKGASGAKAIDEIQIEDVVRIDTKDAELNLVLGGGLVEGSLVLIGGSPGIGKSTLLLKIAANLASPNSPALYVSGEESASQIKMRADRLGAINKNLFLLTEINLNTILDEISNKNYKSVIIDSIQTLYSDKISSAPGSVTQVREITFELMRLAKERGISIFIIGHITKEGSIAGPRILEHMVDVVLYFEGDASKELRILRGFKNRFGSTSEVGIFEMSEKGLISAKDVASKFFTRTKPASGSAITVTMEGSRALVVEIQALVCESSYPKRSATGYDKNRLDMLLALLDRKLEIGLGGYDVFVNVIGGVKITETACDLAVVAAIVSSFKNRPLSKESAFIGEVSLNGEIREIFNLDARIKEASLQKFKNIISPMKPQNSLGLKIFHATEISQILDWM